MTDAPFPQTPTTPHTPSHLHPNDDPPPPSSTNDTTISTSEVHYILSSCTADFRIDGRSNLDHRPYHLSLPRSPPPPSSSSSLSSSLASPPLPPLLLSNGSSRLSLPGSNTDILCSIRAELVHPPVSSPNRGILDLNLDIQPYADPFLDKRRLRVLESETASVLKRLFLPHVLHTPSLVVVGGRYVWRLNIDVMVLRCDGTLLDGCSLVIKAALDDLRLPRVVPIDTTATATPDNDDHAPVSSLPSTTNTNPNQSKKNTALNDLLLDSDITHSVRPEGIDRCPIVVTVYLLPKFVGDESMSFSSTHTQNQNQHDNDTNNNHGSAIHRVKKRKDTILIVDATKQEEACASTKISVSVDPQGRICGIHKHGSNPFDVVGGGGGGDGSRSSSSSSRSGGGGTVPFAMLSKISNVAVAVAKRLEEVVTNRSYEDDDGDGGHWGRGKEERGSNGREYGDLLRGSLVLR